MTTDVPQAVREVFNAIVRERGGSLVFSEFQLECAMAIAWSLIDAQSTDPVSRLRIMESTAKLLDRLPPPIAPAREPAPGEIDFRGLSLEQMGKLYGAMMGDPRSSIGAVPIPVGPPPPGYFDELDDDLRDPEKSDRNSTNSDARPQPPSAPAQPVARAMPPAPETAPAPLQAAEPASDPIFDQPRIRPPRESRYAAILHKLDESPERADAFNNTGHTDMAALLRSQGWR